MESPQIVLAISVGMSALDAVDGSSTGTEVPWMWVLLRPPRFGGAKHASGHDNRSRYRQVCFSNMQPRVKEKAPRRRGPNSEPKRREGCVPTTRVYSRFVPDICIILGAVPATARRGAKQNPAEGDDPAAGFCTRYAEGAKLLPSPQLDHLCEHAHSHARLGSLPSLVCAERVARRTVASIVPAQQRAATTQTPRRPIGAGGARGVSRSGSGSTTTTHALFALKVQRKVRNGVAGLAAGGASLDRKKSRPIRALQRCRSMANIGAQCLLKIPAARGPSGISPAAQLKCE
jgi:hypothetical protein